MATIYISIGSNINPAENIQRAIRDLQQSFDEINCSTHYESEAVGFEGDNFINLVVRAETEMGIQEVAKQLHAIEDQGH